MKMEMLAAGLGLAAVLALAAPTRVAAQIMTDERATEQASERFVKGAPSDALSGAGADAVDARGAGTQTKAKIGLGKAAATRQPAAKAKPTPPTPRYPEAVDDDRFTGQALLMGISMLGGLAFVALLSTGF